MGDNFRERLVKARRQSLMSPQADRAPAPEAGEEPITESPAGDLDQKELMKQRFAARRQSLKMGTLTPDKPAASSDVLDENERKARMKEAFAKRKQSFSVGGAINLTGSSPNSTDAKAKMQEFIGRRQSLQQQTKAEIMEEEEKEEGEKEDPEKSDDIKEEETEKDAEKVEDDANNQPEPKVAESNDVETEPENNEQIPQSKIAPAPTEAFPENDDLSKSDEPPSVPKIEQIFGEEHPTVGHAHLTKAETLLRSGDLDAALLQIQTANEIFSKKDPAGATVADCHFWAGKVYLEKGEHDESMKEFETARAILEKLDGPASVREASSCVIQIGLLLSKLGRDDEALEKYDLALKLRKSVSNGPYEVEEEDETGMSEFEKANYFLRRGAALTDKKLFSESFKMCQSALVILRDLQTDDRGLEIDAEELTSAVSNCLVHLGIATFDTDLQQSVVYYEEALQLRQQPRK